MHNLSSWFLFSVHQIILQLWLHNSITDKSWLSSTDHAMHCITPSHHCAVHKAGHCVLSTSDSHQSTVDNTWQWSTCRRKIIPSSEVGKKLQRELRLSCRYLKHVHCICSINTLQLKGALSPRPEALDPLILQRHLILFLIVDCCSN